MSKYYIEIQKDDDNDIDMVYTLKYNDVTYYSISSGLHNDTTMCIKQSKNRVSYIRDIDNKLYRVIVRPQYE